MAGLGRRTFAPGEVLTATNVMGYLQDQAVMNFAGTAARGSAIGTAVSEGMVSYLADNNFLQAHDGTAWRSIGGVQVASGTATRDALLPSPVQGDKVFRNDLGYEQTYYGAYNSSTNPGGRSSAGWYDNQRNMGLVPIVPPTVRVSGGTATANTLGKVSFTSVSSIQLDGIFTDTYSNYVVQMVETGVSANTGLSARFTAGGTPNSSSIYYGAFRYMNSAGTNSSYASPNPIAFFYAGELLASGYTMNMGVTKFEIVRTATGIRSSVSANNFAAAYAGAVDGVILLNTLSPQDGLIVYPGTGGVTFSGTVQVFGYNS